MASAAIGARAAGATGRSRGRRKIPGALEPAGRHETFQSIPFAPGAGDIVVAEHEGLELFIALQTFVFINGHVSFSPFVISNFGNCDLPALLNKS